MREKLHGYDLRKGRVSIENQIYLVTTVTCNRIPLFKDFAAGRLLVHELMQADRNDAAKTLAFVIMPDHIHWLFALGLQHSLSRVVGCVKSSSAREINRLLSRSDRSVWQRGFHDHALRREEDIRHVARYIVANPLRAGLIERIGGYPLWDAAWL
jgi:REP element-mobilizing transposase RayT